MEEKKTLKIKKPRLIIFALAIAFAIMGFIDLKANAAENLVEDIPYNEQYCKVSYFTYDYVNKTYRLRDWDLHTPHTRIALYYGDFTDNALDPDNTNNVIQNVGKGYRLCVLRDPNNSMQYWETGSYSEVHYDKDMNVKSSDGHEYGYGNTLSHAESVPTSNPDWKCIGSLKNNEKVENLTIDTNIPIFTDWACLREYLETGYYDPSGVVVDYSKLETDDNMPVISDILYNFIRNEKPSSSDTTGLGIIKDIEYYDYLTWKNNADFSIQIEYCPIVQVFNGFTNLILDKEYYGDWSDYEILEKNTTNYTKRVDKEYLNENEPYLYEYKSEIIDSYTNYGQYTHLFIGYRLRYVDSANLKAGAWTYLVPDKNGNYYSYSQYSDGSVSDNKDSVGTDNTYQDTDVEDAKNDIDKENEVKVEVGSSNSEIDIDGATNWLQSVASFIKGTPSFVGSVMSFLPEPIRYGMYVCLFLGVIASGYAIVKALI